MRAACAAIVFLATNAQFVSGLLRGPSEPTQSQEPTKLSLPEQSIFARRADDLEREGVPPLGVKPEDVVTDMWNGRDFDDHNTFTFERLAGELTHDDVPDDKPWVQVMGLENSGTDLLNALLYLNFGWRLEYYSDKVGIPNHAEGMWRFANLQAAYRADHRDSKFSKGAVKVLIVVRNPLSWLRAMKENAPEEFESCVMGQNWLSKSCLHNHPAGMGSPAPSATYTSLMDVWNQWTSGYQHASANGIKNSTVITYEDIVHDPLLVMQNIATFLGIEEPAMHLNPDTPEGFGLTHAQEALNGKLYLDFFTDPQKQVVCRGLEAKLQEAYGYDDDCK